jgi:hypothetical protein
MKKHASVSFKSSEYNDPMRYIHKYYLPQKLKNKIFPTDIDGIVSSFIEGKGFNLWEKHIRRKPPECLIYYHDIGLEKRIDSDTVRRVLKAYAEYHYDCRAKLTTKEVGTALRLNARFVEWEKNLLLRCIQIRDSMELQVSSGDSWLTDYHMDVKVGLYARKDDPFSEDNMLGGSFNDIDCNTALLCTIKLLLQVPVRNCRNEEMWGIGDNQDHNDVPRGSRTEEIYNVRHCATFHELFSHMNMPVKHAGRIGCIYTSITITQQNETSLDFSGKAIADIEPRA